MNRALPMSAFVAVACGTPRTAPDEDAAPRASGPSGLSLATVLAASFSTSRPRYDAGTRLDGPVAAFLVTRAGSASRSGGQCADVSLLMVWVQRSVRVELGAFEAPLASPFGVITAASAFPARAYDSAVDAFAGAPPWTGPELVLLATTVVDVRGDAHAYVVSRDGDAVLVDHAASDVRTWERIATIALRQDTQLTVPHASVGVGIGNPVRVSIDESIDSLGPELQVVRTSLGIGEANGPLLDEAVVPGLDDRWDFAPFTTLPLPPPPGELLAWRTYREHATDEDARVLAQLPDRLVLWRREGSPVWTEEVGVPLPHGAKIVITQGP